MNLIVVSNLFKTDQIKFFPSNRSLIEFKKSKACWQSATLTSYAKHRLNCFIEEILPSTIFNDSVSEAMENKELCFSNNGVVIEFILKKERFSTENVAEFKISESLLWIYW